MVEVRVLFGVAEIACVVEANVLVGGTGVFCAVDVGSPAVESLVGVADRVPGRAEVGVTGPGVGERVGTVCRAGF